MATITYYITRDSDAFGVLSDTVDVWNRRPIRAKLTIDAGYVWLPSDEPGVAAGRASADLGYVAKYKINEATKKYGTIPDTDREIIRMLVMISE